MRTPLTTAGTATILFILAASAYAAERLVVIDVTQSKAKPGTTTAYGESEWNFNRVIAADLEQALRSHRMRTRLVLADGATSTDLSNNERLKEFSGADLVISIAGEAMPNQFYRFWNVSGHRTAYVDRFTGYSVSVSRSAQSPLSLLCGSAVATALNMSGYASSDHLLEGVISGDKSTAIADSDGPVYFNESYTPLKNSPYPIIMLEAGVLQNPNDETRLKQESYRKKLVGKVAAALVACLSE